MIEYTIGRHRITLYPPDTIIIANDGAVSFQDATGLKDRMEAFAQGKERLFMLIDVTRSGVMEPEARKLVVTSMGGLPVAGIAIFGATFSIRVASTLMAKAVSLLYPSAPAMRFFASEADARAWLGQQRP